MDKTTLAPATYGRQAPDPTVPTHPTATHRARHTSWFRCGCPCPQRLESLDPGSGHSGDPGPRPAYAGHCCQEARVSEGAALSTRLIPCHSTARREAQPRREPGVVWSLHWGHLVRRQVGFHRSTPGTVSERRRDLFQFSSSHRSHPSPYCSIPLCSVHLSVLRAQGGLGRPHRDLAVALLPSFLGLQRDPHTRGTRAKSPSTRQASWRRRQRREDAKPAEVLPPLAVPRLGHASRAARGRPHGAQGPCLAREASTNA